MISQLVTSEEQSALLANLDFALPSDYIDFIFSCNFTDDGTSYSYFGDAGWLAGATSVIGYNEDYCAAEFYSGYFLIGTDQGCEVFAIEKKTGYFVMTPFVGHDEESVIIIGKTWAEFKQRLDTNNLWN